MKSFSSAKNGINGSFRQKSKNDTPMPRYNLSRVGVHDFTAMYPIENSPMLNKRYMNGSKKSVRDPYR